MNEFMNMKEIKKVFTSYLANKDFTKIVSKRLSF